MGTIFGFVGWPCAGKDEAAGYLQRRYEAQRFGHSDIIRELAAELGIPIIQTAQLSALFESRAAAEGDGWIARIIAERIQELWMRDPGRLTVVAGVRHMGEVETYAELPNFQLVKIVASFEERLRRAVERQRPGERELTRELFRQIEVLPGNANIPKLMALPGTVIVNNRSKSDFYLEINRLVARFS